MTFLALPQQQQQQQRALFHRHPPPNPANSRSAKWLSLGLLVLFSMNSITLEQHNDLILLPRQLSSSASSSSDTATTTMNTNTNNAHTMTNDSKDDDDDTPRVPLEMQGLRRGALWEHFDCDVLVHQENDDSHNNDENATNDSSTKADSNSNATNTTLLFNNFERPVNHTAVWKTMRQTYLRVFDPHNTSLQQQWLEDGSSSSLALQVPYSVRRSPGKGLGLFLETNIITNGTKVYDTSRGGGQVRFTRGPQLRRFMARLSELGTTTMTTPNNGTTTEERDSSSNHHNDNSISKSMANYMACMVLQCSTVESNNVIATKARLEFLRQNATEELRRLRLEQNSTRSNQTASNNNNNNSTSEDEEDAAWRRRKTQLNRVRRELMRRETYIAVDLDDGCFANGASSHDSDTNIGGPDEEQCCDYAQRDIVQGEELVWSYGSYSFASGWRWFGL